MTMELVISMLGLLMIGGLFAGFRFFAGERWQFLGSVPVRRLADGAWECRNLTWYGFLSATALSFAILILIFLMAATGTPPATTALVATALLGLCLPASARIAHWVDGKAHTFSVGAAAFVGMLAAPWGLLLFKHLLGPGWGSIEPIPFLAGFSVAYAFGEGIGRLACISFGCCYGKPVAQMKFGQAFFRRWQTAFPGATRKTAYAGGLEHVPLVPVQAMSALVCTMAGLVSLTLFMRGRYAGALMVAVLLTQGWRWVAEFLRTDPRGVTKISAYQAMSVAAALYTCLIARLFQTTALAPDWQVGFRSLGHPGLMFFLAALWLVVFYRMGVSTVTTSRTYFEVRLDRV